MKRRDFFRKATLGMGALIAAPVVAKAVVEDAATQETFPWEGKECTPYIPGGTWEQIDPKNIHPHYAQYADAYPPLDIDTDVWRELYEKYGKGISIFDFIHPFSPKG